MGRQLPQSIGIAQRTELFFLLHSVIFQNHFQRLEITEGNPRRSMIILQIILKI